MDTLGIGGYYPVQGAQPAAAAAETAAPRGSEAAVPATDTSAVTGQAHAGQPLSAEAALALLHETGLVESASRPLTPEAAALLGDPVTVTVDLETGAAEAPLPQNQTLMDEWRPYQPPAAAAAHPPLLTDGAVLTLRLFPASAGLEGLLLRLGSSSLPLDGAGQALAGFLDGSFRRLTFDQEALDAGISQGSVRVEAPPDKAPDAPPAEARTETAAEPAAPAAAPAAKQPGAARFSPVPQLPLRVPEQPEVKPGGALEWAAARGAERSFRANDAAWLARTPDPAAPEARAELAAARQTWAGTLAREDPVAFRAWLDLLPEETAAGERPEEAPLPQGFTREDYLRWTARPTQDYARAPETPEGAAGRYLAGVLSRMAEAGDTQAAALLRGTAGLLSRFLRSDDSADLSRRVSELLSQQGRGTQRASTRAWSESLELPTEPRQREGELDRAWKRRRIAFAVDTAWTENLKTWLAETDGKQLDECRRYVNGKTDAWTTGLMREQPASFRHWLGSPVRYAASTGGFDAAVGSFPIETLPSGFTEEDYQRWMRFDVLDYL